MSEEKKEPEVAKKPAPKADVYINTYRGRLNFSGTLIEKGGELKPTKDQLESERFRMKLARAVENGLLKKL